MAIMGKSLSLLIEVKAWPPTLSGFSQFTDALYKSNNFNSEPDGVK